MGLVVGLTGRLGEDRLGTLRELLRERGLSVAERAEVIERDEPVRAVLRRLLRRSGEQDVVLLAGCETRYWSGVLDGFFGAGFRLLAGTTEPDEPDYAATDFVLRTDGATEPDLGYAVATLTGAPGLRPRRYEHALFLAEGQATRSAALRGRVGCALLDEVGDVLALGTNEVPRAGGGQYWPDSPDDARDPHDGVDPARAAKTAIVESVLAYARDRRSASLGDVSALASEFIDQLDGTGERPGLPSQEDPVRALESLGRVVHAELAALGAAARHGASVMGAHAVVTRPPCRQCLRQLIVSGVASVRFLGPAAAARYPFHADAITGEPGTPDKLLVAPIGGVTPRGYAKVFGGPGAFGRSFRDWADLDAVDAELDELLDVPLEFR